MTDDGEPVGMGSSPLARGTPEDIVKTELTAGLIPARAGNTPYVCSIGGGVWAHPRSRGEHLVGHYRVPFQWGSSPLARGTLSYVGLAVCATGLIPARAGNTELER